MTPKDPLKVTYKKILKKILLKKTPNKNFKITLK